MLSAIIPAPYRLLGLSLLAAALVGIGWVKGTTYVQNKWDAENMRQSLQVATVKKLQAEATVQIVTKYVERVKVVREAGDTIIKEVPTYVPLEADAACVLSRDFVRLHDAAASGRLPDPAGGTDAPAAGIALSTVASTVADNYERCHENAEQITALQQWISEGERIPDIKSNAARGGK